MCRLTTRAFSTTRIDLLLKNRLGGSRKAVQDLIRRQRVVDVEGNKILSAAKKVPSAAVVYVDGREVPPAPLLALCHKPVGVLSTMGDPTGRPSLLRLVERFPFLKAMHPVGRLDSDTSGLLLFSSDGCLTNILLQPQSCIEREYEAVVTGLVDFNDLKSLLSKGIQTSSGVFPANLKECTHIKYDASLGGAFKTSKDFDLTLGPLLQQYADLSQPALSRVLLSVTEGKHRMVRRVLHNAGHSVVQLKRVAYGQARLRCAESGHCCIADSDTQQWARGLLRSADHSRPKRRDK